MIERNAYLEKVLPFIDTDLIKIFTGIRRCGKSVMLDLIKNEAIFPVFDFLSCFR